MSKPEAAGEAEPTPYAPAWADCLNENYRHGLRIAAITYLDECFAALQDRPENRTYEDTAIGWYLPERFAHLYDAAFARKWMTTVTIVGWKLAQPERIPLASVAEELGLNALIQHAIASLDSREHPADPEAFGEFREFAFEDEDYLWLFDPAMDGIEDTEWAQQHVVIGLRPDEWFAVFGPGYGRAHPFLTD